jgi:beta-xylosidase
VTTRRRLVLLAGFVGALLVVGVTALAFTFAPSYGRDFADPFVLRVGGTYYAYATQWRDTNVQVITSTDLVRWSTPHDALPRLPEWAAWGHTWAPAVLARRDRYVLYYTVRDRASNRQCISSAISTSPAGGFVDRSAGPLVCQLDHGGSIDPYPFVDDDGRAYLLWKSDDNALGRKTSVWAQRLSDDGLALAGVPVHVLGEAYAWQAPSMEGPAMTRSGNTYYLFYGANWWASSTAGIGYATCTTPLGPCVDRATNGPWLGTHTNAVGPSGPAFFTDLAGLHVAYHAWTGGVGYGKGGVRSLWIDGLTFVAGKPTLTS